MDMGSHKVYFEWDDLIDSYEEKSPLIATLLMKEGWGLSYDDVTDEEWENLSTLMVDFDLELDIDPPDPSVGFMTAGVSVNKVLGATLYNGESEEEIVELKSKELIEALSDKFLTDNFENEFDWDTAYDPAYEAEQDRLCDEARGT
jgi:hypothetical protein